MQNSSMDCMCLLHVILTMSVTYQDLIKQSSFRAIQRFVIKTSVGPVKLLMHYLTGEINQNIDFNLVAQTHIYCNMTIMSQDAEFYSK